MFAVPNLFSYMYSPWLTTTPNTLSIDQPPSPSTLSLHGRLFFLASTKQKHAPLPLIFNLHKGAGSAPEAQEVQNTLGTIADIFLPQELLSSRQKEGVGVPKGRNSSLLRNPPCPKPLFCIKQNFRINKIQVIIKNLNNYIDISLCLKRCIHLPPNTCHFQLATAKIPSGYLFFGFSQ